MESHFPATIGIGNALTGNMTNKPHEIDEKGVDINFLPELLMIVHLSRLPGHSTYVLSIIDFRKSLHCYFLLQLCPVFNTCNSVKAQ